MKASGTRAKAEEGLRGRGAWGVPPHLPDSLLFLVHSTVGCLFFLLPERQSALLFVFVLMHMAKQRQINTERVQVAFEGEGGGGTGGVEVQTSRKKGHAHAHTYIHFPSCSNLYKIRRKRTMNPTCTTSAKSEL